MADITYNYDSLFLLNVKDSEAVASDGRFYYIDKDRLRFYKFYSDDNTFLYSPASINLTAYQVSGTSRTAFTGSIEAEFYTTSNTLYKTVTPGTDSSQNILRLTLQDSTSMNIGYIILKLLYDSADELSVVYSLIWEVNYGTSELMAKFEVGATSISGSINGTKVKFNTDGIEIYNGQLALYSADETRMLYFDLASGQLYINGNITSNSGNIGGWVIGENSIYSSDNKTGLSSSDQLRFWSGKNNNDNTYQFYVDSLGYLYSQNATINGTIYASDGYITNKFLVGNKNNGIILFGGDSLNESYISSAQFASGAFGYGWKLNEDGSANFTNAYVSGTITSSVFKYETTSSVGGNLYVSPTVISIKDTEIITSYKNIDGTITKSYSSIFYFLAGDLSQFEVGQSVIISGNLLNNDNTINTYCSAIISSIASGIITVQYSTDFQLQGTWLNGTSVINDSIGLFLTATDSYGPFLDVFNNHNHAQPLVRLGNLQGITDSEFGGALDGYGLYSTNAYLKGQLILPYAGITDQKEYTIVTTDEGDTSPIRIWAGLSDEATNITLAKFIVTLDGTMIAQQGIFNGTVNATDSTFSGVIKAAGIVIDNTDTLTIEADNDHFFVGYSNNPTNNDDYIIDINKNGISIWLGGFQVYSDEAKNVISLKNLYGYYDQSDNNLPNYSDPLPIIYIKDEKVLHNDVSQYYTLLSRLITYNQHFIQVSGSMDNYNSNSIIINDGIWFGHIEGVKDKTDVLALSYNTTNQKTVGIKGSQSDLMIMANNFNIECDTLLNGQLSVQAKDDYSDNEIILGNYVIKQYKSGIDFIVS